MSGFMERRAIPRNPVLMSGAIQFAGCLINCLVCDMTISAAALEVAEPHDIPKRFNLVFKADGTHIPCHVVWRQEDLCVPKTLSVLMTPRNHLSWRNERAPVFRRGRLGLANQSEDPARG